MITNRGWHQLCRCLSDRCSWLRECWLLLLVAGRLLVLAGILLAGWLLVASAGCWMIAGCGWKNDCWLFLLVAGWLLVTAGKLLAGEKVFEYFQDIDDLPLRQFCRLKSLWIIPGFWWFAAKTILPAKKSLNIFGILMICRWIHWFEEILLSLLKLRLRKILVRIHLGRWR